MFFTKYAAALRSSPENIARDSDLLNRETLLQTIIDASPNIVAILNENRQIVFANKALYDLVQADDRMSVLGKRPGEVINCKHSCESPCGCGTTKFCRYCGAVNAILKSQLGETAVEECRILTIGDRAEDALDLRVWTMPFDYGNRRFTCFTAVNIADEKQRYFMERIFLHDIMNIVGALKGFLELVVRDGTDETRERLMQRSVFLAQRVIDEINSYRQIIAAENNELVVQKKEINSLAFINMIYDCYSTPEILNNRRLVIDEASQEIVFVSDETLLSRVVGNMVRNAIEASGPGETVVVGCFVADGFVNFRVHNPTYMPENVRLQVFNRSFSTKGTGRGLGTYSMKYLTEKYLQGRISFTSSEKGGTAFTASYPLELRP